MEKINLNQKTKTILTVLTVAVILLWSVYLGFSNGQKNAYAQLVVKNFSASQEALNFFFLDQDRFPSVLEFTDRNIMQNYFSLLPFTESFFNLCENNLQYFRQERKKYTINVCVPVAIGDFKKGVNVFEIKK